MKLLLAEDEVALSKALVTMLQFNKYIVDSVYNGQDAIDYIKAKEYDGIILDIMMPKVDGLTVLKTVREMGITTPIIMLTAKSEVDDKCLGLDLGADDYLSKPFSTKELLSRIAAIIRRKGDLVSGDITYGNLTLDRKSFELYSNKGRVKLINKEYQIMELFMMSPNIVFSIDTLIDKIWNADKYTEINTIWVYISNLRKKLKEIESDVEILSSRNLGYYIGKK